jgi:hypothetical protein
MRIRSLLTAAVANVRTRLHRQHKPPARHFHPSPFDP